MPAGAAWARATSPAPWPTRPARHDRSARYFSLSRLSEDLLRAGATQKRGAFFKQLARIDLLVLDDFGLSPISEDVKRDLLENIDDRFDRSSTIITSQLPVDQWHRYLDDPTQYPLAFTDMHRNRVPT